MNQEKIICSAIHIYLTDKFEKQPIGIEQGFVISGRRHSDCYAILDCMSMLSGFTNKVVKELVNSILRKHQGFITNHNRYVNRKEAAIIAHKANQMLQPAFYCEGYELTSEDLFLDLYQNQ